MGFIFVGGLQSVSRISIKDSSQLVSILNSASFFEAAL